MTTQTTVQMTSLQRQYTKSRDAAVPLVVVQTSDPALTITSLSLATQTEKDGVAAPVLQWDCVKGFRGVNQEGTAVIASQAWKQGVPPVPMLNPWQALEHCERMPRHAALFFMNGHEYYKEPQFVQALWNLRDVLKRDSRTVVITQPGSMVPTALEHDLLVLEEPLPGADELRSIVRKQYTAIKNLPALTDDMVARAVDSLAGLSAFAAEQALVLSFNTKTGVDFERLRDRHRKMIENTKGLSVWTGGGTFDELGGLSNYKHFARRFLAGRYRVGAVGWFDEVEKALAGVRGDLTGISQDYLSVLLSYMQDHNVPGILLMGHPGTGKSALAKAMGSSAGVPTIRADLGAMHGSLVGDSQHAIRHALRVMSAVSQGRPLFVATCNSVAVMPPEFVNRFKFRFFVDLPDEAEKKTIWPIHRRRFEIDPKDEGVLDDNLWNGREIEQCCATAYQLKCSLQEAAEFVVPIAHSSAEVIERRRSEAAGRYLSASKPGAYSHEEKTEVQVGERTVRVRDDAGTWIAPEKKGQWN